MLEVFQDLLHDTKHNPRTAAQEMLQNGSILTPPGFSLGPVVHSTTTTTAAGAGPPSALLLCLNQRPQQGEGREVAVCAPPTTPARLQASKAGIGLVRNLVVSSELGGGGSGSSSICSAALEVVSGGGRAVARSVGVF